MLKVRNQTRPAIARARELRREMGAAEKKLWAALRNRKHEFKFRRQHPVGPYFLDFYCAEAKLCVEVDGDLHADREDRDAARDAYLAVLGIETLRIGTWNLYEDLECVIDRIWRACLDRTDR